MLRLLKRLMSDGREFSKQASQNKCGDSSITKSLETLAISSKNKSTEATVGFFSNDCGKCNDSSYHAYGIQPLYVGNNDNLSCASDSATDNTKVGRELLGNDIGLVNLSGKSGDDGSNTGTYSFEEHEISGGDSYTVDNHFDVGNFVENLGLSQRTRSTITSRNERQPEQKRRGRLDTSITEEMENQSLLGFWSKLGSLYRQNRDGVIYPTVPYSIRKLANMWRGGAFYASSIERIRTEVKTDGRDYFHESLISLTTTKWDEVIDLLKSTDIPGGIDFVERLEKMGLFRVTFSKTMRIVLTDEGRTTSKCIVFWECRPKFGFKSVFILCCHMIVVY